MSDITMLLRLRSLMRNRKAAVAASDDDAVLGIDSEIKEFCSDHQDELEALGPRFSGRLRAVTLEAAKKMADVLDAAVVEALAERERDA